VSLVTNQGSKFQNSKWRIQYGGLILFLYGEDQIRNVRVFRVSYDESIDKIAKSKFKLADPIWRFLVINFDIPLWKYITLGTFFGRR